MSVCNVCVCVRWGCLLSRAASLVTAYCLMLVTAMDAYSSDLCFQNKLWRQFSTVQTTKVLSVVLAGDKIGSCSKNCGSDSAESKQKLKSFSLQQDSLNLMLMKITLSGLMEIKYQLNPDLINWTNLCVSTCDRRLCVQTQ